jgi:hypothetical protein
MESIQPVLTNGIAPFDLSGGLELAKNNFLLDPLSNNPELGAAWKVGAMSSELDQPLTLSAQEVGNPSSGLAQVLMSTIFRNPRELPLDTAASNLTSETGVFTVGETSDRLLFGGISATAVVPDPGNTLGTAYNVGTLTGTQTFTDSVGSTDTSDIYRFSLGATSNFNLSLTGMSNDADVRLIRDANNNGIIDTGEVIASSTRGSNSDESINNSSLAAGTYFAQVYQFSGDTNYTLRLSTTSPSNLLPTETNIGTLSSTRTFSDSVNSTDTSDIYRFTVNQSGIFTANLAGLTGDADVRLIQDRNNNGQIDQGEVLAWQWERGTGSESIRHFLNSGNYFMQVMGYNNQTANYSLSTNFTAAISDNRRFDIQVNLGNGLTGLNTPARNAIEQAAQFWEQVISHSTFNGVHNLRIDVTGASLSNNTLAQAGPRGYQRDANNRDMPVTGAATINSNQFSTFNSDSNYLRDIMIHEFGHVLGIGTLWESRGRSFVRRADGTYNSNTYAGWAYGELNGTFRQTAIPLTTGVGSGSDYSHWREQVFTNEIMTHAIGSGGSPMSQMTIASLRDIGWNVNYGAAQPYSLSNPVVRVTVNRVQAIDNLDGIFGSADFYARVNIGGIEQRSDDVSDRNDISPNWQFSHGTSTSSVPLTIRIFDADSGLFGSDEHVDINPLRGQRDLQLTYDLNTGRISSNDGSGVSGRRGELITVRGAGDSDRALLQFTVDQFPV